MGFEPPTSAVQSQSIIVTLSRAFAVVQKYLQNGRLSSMMLHCCSPLFAWVGVLLV
jgi:hypothetical protein